MRASPDYLTHGRYAPLEQRGWKLGRSVARHMGVSVHTQYWVNQILPLDRQVALAEVVGSRSWRGVLGEKRGGGGSMSGAAAAGPANLRAGISPSSDGDPGGRMPAGTPSQTTYHRLEETSIRGIAELARLQVDD